MPNTIADNLDRLKATVPAIRNSIITKGGTVNSGDGLEEFPADIMSIKNDLTSIDITENGTYYGGEETDVTSSTFPVVVNDSNGTPVRHADVDGNTVQSSTPTPQDPVMPNGTGDKTGNLWDFGQWLTDRGATYTKDGDSYTFESQQALYSTPFYFSQIDIIISISGLIEAVTATNPRIHLLKADGTRAKTDALTTANSKYENISCAGLIFDWSTPGNIKVSLPMLNIGSKALPYEPHGYKLDISSGGENLCLVSQSNSIYYAALNMYSVSNNSVTVTGEALFGFICKATPNTDYTVSAYADTIGAQLRIREYSDVPTEWSANFIKQPLNNQLKTYTDSSFTTDSLTTWLLVVFYTPPTITHINIFNIMLNHGSSPLPYEPYNRTTAPVYLGEVETTRRIRKRVFDGTESWQKGNYPPSGGYQFFTPKPSGIIANPSSWIITHFVTGKALNGSAFASYLSLYPEASILPENATADDFKAWLAAQYANGTPVTVWYVLANEETGIVNEPLMKIGDYADSLSVDIELPLSQNAKNNIDIDTTVKPSSASFTYNKLSDYIGYNEINVNVPSEASTLVSKTITENGTYDPSDDSADGYSSVVVDVPSAPTQNPNFYDYDGTVVASYTKEEFAALSALPANPSHTGLTSQGWNWSLADAKEYVAEYGKLNVGQMYVTDDGKTRIYITLTEGRTSPILQLYLNANSELDIDWGDGSTHSTFTTTSAGYVNERHNYTTPGDYVIAITVTTGSFVLQSSSSSVSNILWNGNSSTSSPDRAYNNSIQKIEIGTGITSIGTYAFNNCYSLSSITIPDGVTTIGNNAFQNCYSLSSITIPDTVTSIGATAFYGCSALSSVTIPDGVTSIGNNAFAYCYSLSSITIPDGVTTIGNNAFQQCYSLTSITIPDSVTTIGSNAFYGCSSLSSITIGNSVTSISNQAFYGCSALSSVTIPDGVTSIGNNAFAYCYSLTSITIPDSVTSIDTQAFFNCSSLSSITIGNSVTSIGNNAFYGCYSLSSITIPDSVTSIGTQAFYNCSSLSSITIGNSVTTIGSNAFIYCYSLTSITIPDSVTTIGNNAFQNCYSLSSITIGNSVTSIGNAAFFNCSSLSSITIGNSVTTIGSSAFNGCAYMSYIKFESTTPPTVSNSNAWSNVSTSTKILVPAGTLETYTTATNYPNPSTYTYEEY